MRTAGTRTGHPQICWMCESDGLRSHNCILPPGAILIAVTPPRRPAVTTRQGSFTPRRKLTPEQEVAIQTCSAAESLRSLAADFGVNHETIRAVVGQAGVARAS